MRINTNTQDLAKAKCNLERVAMAYSVGLSIRNRYKRGKKEINLILPELVI